MSNAKNQQPYFPHYANSRNEDDLIRLRMEHGCTGYGVYYMLLERLRMSEDYRCTLDYKVLAFDLRCDESLIESVICDFGLFEIGEDGLTFSSCEMNEYMRFMEERKQKRIEAARKAAEARWGKSHADVTDDEASGHSEQTPAQMSQTPGMPELPEWNIDDQTLLSGFTDAAATERLNSEILVMAHDNVWLNAVLGGKIKSEDELYALMVSFRTECIKNGKKNGHKCLADAQTHFRFWLEKKDSAPENDEERAVKEKKGRQKKTESEKQAEKDAAIAERNEKYAEQKRSAQSPENYIRNKGYDPNVVDLAMIMKPGFMTNNPPTHPEWIGQFCGNSEEPACKSV